MTGHMTPELPAGVAPDAPRALVRGLANSGASGLARARAAALAADAAPGEGVLLVVASDLAAEGARAWLAARGADGVRVACARDIELEILSTPEARAATGRVPRLRGHPATSVSPYARPGGRFPRERGRPPVCVTAGLAYVGVSARRRGLAVRPRWPCEVAVTSRSRGGPARSR